VAINVGKYLAQEKLHIERVVELETAQRGEDDFDLLADELVKNKELQERQEEAPDSEEEEDIDTEDAPDSENDTTDPSEDTENASEASEEDVSTEHYAELHKGAQAHLVAMEAQFLCDTASRLGIAQEGVGSFMYRNLVRKDSGEDGLLLKLKDLGIHYSKVGLTHFAKGMLYALAQTAAAISRGTRQLIRYAYQRSKSYSKLALRIDKARAILAQLPEQQNDGGVFIDAVTIASLKVGNSADFKKHIGVLLEFNRAYLHQMPGYTKVCVAGVNKTINHVMSGSETVPLVSHVQSLPIAGLHHVKTEHGLDTYHYPKVLPGDMNFTVQTPSRELRAYDDIKTAYRASQATMVLNDRLASAVPVKCPYLTPDVMKEYLDIMAELCRHGMQLTETFRQVSRYRSQLKPSLESYIRYLGMEHGRLTIRESLAEFVGLKTSYVDNVVVKGAMIIHDLNLTVISAALNYVKASLENATRK